MQIATFGPGTAWIGKAISYDNGQFVLEEIGPIAAQAVVDYDRQVHLVWAYDGLREWAYQTAGQPLPAPAAEAAPAIPPAGAAPAEASRHVAPSVTPPAGPAVAQPVTPPAGPEVAPPVTPPAASAVAPPATPPAAPTPAAPQAGGAGRSGWFALGGVVIVALLIGIVLAGGRLRDGLGIALTSLAVIALAALLVALTKPAALSRMFSGAGPRALLVACSAMAVGCFVLAGLFWWIPHYEVVAPTDKRIALDDRPAIKVRVVNRGLFGGTYSGVYAVDGKEQDAVAFPLGGGDGREITLSLPSGVERGPVLLSLGGASIEARAVAPPAFVVAPLQVDPSPAKLGDDVVLTTSVKNTGDIAGTFGGSLTVDGEELLKQPVEIAAGQTKDVTYHTTADGAGIFQLALGDAAAEFVIVKPVRLANGYVIDREAKGGRASVTIVNETGSDAVAVLTRSSNKRKPVLAVYIRSGKKTKVAGIPDGAYVVWDCCGEGFNWTMRGFYATAEYKRWLDPLKFNTTASTRHWTDYWSDASYNYSQGRSQTTTRWTNWTVTLGVGESKYTKLVAESGFPQL